MNDNTETQVTWKGHGQTPVSFATPKFRGSPSTLLLTLTPVQETATAAITAEARALAHDNVLASVREAWQGHPARARLEDARECLRGSEGERRRLDEERRHLEHALQSAVGETTATKLGAKLGQLQRQLDAKRQELSDCNAGISALRQREAEAREVAKAVLSELAREQRFATVAAVAGEKQTLFRGLLDALAGDLYRLAVLDAAGRGSLPPEQTIQREALGLLDEGFPVAAGPSLADLCGVT